MSNLTIKIMGLYFVSLLCFKNFIPLAIHFYCKSKNVLVCDRLEIKAGACSGSRRSSAFVTSLTHPRCHASADSKK